MKKQILFLAIFTLAIVFAGTNKAFGQALGASSSPVPLLNCADPSDPGFTPQPLHPFAGVPYIYSLDGTAGTEHAQIYTWWITKNINFISTPGGPSVAGATNITTMLTPPAILNPSSTYGVSTDIGTEPLANQLTVTWSADILAATEYQGDATAAGTVAEPSPTFVVGYAEGENCADNIQVFEINPLPNFTVDIAPIDPTDNATTLDWDNSANTAEVCVDDVQSATYDNTNKTLIMDYGTNTLYFEVAAANFVKDWTPSFYIVSGLLTTQTAILSIYSTLSDATGSGTALATSDELTIADMSTTPGTFSWEPGTHLTATTPSDIATGVSVYVKVVITNNTEESLVNNAFILAVDAQDNTEAGIWDMEDSDCTTLTDVADMIDQATITVTPRPQLDDSTIDTLPNPDTYIEKP